MASVASQNLFDLLGDDEDLETKVEKSKDTVSKAQNETIVVQKHVDRSRASPKEARIKHEYPQRGGFKNSTSRGNDDNRSGPRDLNVGPRLSSRREDNDNNYNNYNNSNSTRNSRGARSGERGRGRGRRGGRDFDRHSGTGRYDSEKKEHQGWGSTNTDWEDNHKTSSSYRIDNNDNNNPNWDLGNNDNAADSNTWNNTESQEQTNEWGGSKDEDGGGDTSWDVGKTEDKSWEMKEEVAVFETSETDNINKENTGEEETSTKNVEPEEVIKTLEEYLSEKAQKALDISLPEARKPNEGVDDSQWKDAVPLEKKEDDDILFSGKEQSFRIKNKSKKSKNFLEIEPTFDKPGGFQRGGRGGGGRGRGGGGRNRDDYDNRDNRRSGGGDRSHDDYNSRDNRRGGSDRNYDDYNSRDNRRRGGGGGGSRSNYVNIDDQRAFPSLGTV